jgi:hypothetical protein
LTVVLIVNLSIFISSAYGTSMTGIDLSQAPSAMALDLS